MRSSITTAIDHPLNGGLPWDPFNGGHFTSSSTLCRVRGITLRSTALVPTRARRLVALCTSESQGLARDSHDDAAGLRHDLGGLQARPIARLSGDRRHARRALV